MSPDPKVCVGVTGVGLCDKRAKYTVNMRPTCGIHLGQIVKWAIAARGSATVMPLTHA